MLTNVADHLAVPKKQLVYDATLQASAKPLQAARPRGDRSEASRGALAGAHLFRKQAAPACCASTGARAPLPMKGPPLEAALQSGFSTSGLQASPACLGARLVQRISLPCEWESVLPPALRYPAFLRPDREDGAAAETLKTATDLFMRTLLGADCFGACQHWDTTIVAHGGRIFLGEDFKERFHATHTKNYAHSSISNPLGGPNQQRWAQ